MLSTKNVFDDDPAYSGESWFVYLLPLAEGRAFKVGFSCNPMQRIYSFNRRYYDRFQIRDSLLLQLHTIADARAVEASIKRRFAEYRASAPTWINDAAGGHTEWFDANCEGDARLLLQSNEHTDHSAQSIGMHDFIRAQLVRSQSWFELWAIDQAKQLQADLESIQLGYAPTIDPTMLRDWIDAYRHFEVPMFADDIAALQFVSSVLRR